MDSKETNNGKKGGLLKGKRHYDKDGKPLGGIKAVVTDTGKQVELEGGEVIINREASKKHWKTLSKINQSAGNGVPILPPAGATDTDPEEYKEGGNIIKFNPNHIPNKWILQYAKKIKSDHPKVWALGGNIFGNEAFKNLKRVYERGYWLDSEEWMYIKWRSYVARHKQDFRIEGVIAMLKWIDKVDKGWDYMKQLIEAEIVKKEKKPFGRKAAEKMKQGGEVTYKQKYNKRFDYDEDETHDLKEIAKDTGVSKKGLQQIYNKGVGAYKTNPESVRPSVKSKEQWAMGRVYSAVMGGKAAKVDAKELKMAEGGGLKDNCIEYINSHEAVLANGYYCVFKNTDLYISIHDKKVPHINSFCLVTYNSGGQKNLKVTDTLNAFGLSRELQKLIGGEKGVSQIILNEFINKAKRLTKRDLATIQGSNIIIANRDTIECENLTVGKMIKGGVIGDIFSVSDPDLFKQIITIYNGFENKFGINNYFIDHNDNSVVFLRGTNFSTKEIDLMTKEILRLKQNFDVLGSKKPHAWENNFKFYLNHSVKYKDGGLIAPNGKQSNLTPEQYKLVRTPAFKAWFGDWEKLLSIKLKDSGIDEVTLKLLEDGVSKVVDENGEPLVVYHGTYVENPFYIFDFDKADIGFHFGTYQQAKNRSETKLFFKGKKSAVNPFFLNIRKIYEVTDIGEWEYPQRYLDMFISDNLISEKDAIKLGFLKMYYKEDNSKIRDYLLKKHSNKIGFEYDNKYEGKGKSYIVLEPNQIKLADGSNTTFDGSNPDIRYAEGGSVKDITCYSCGWSWDKKDSEKHDEYVCHKCGTDNKMDKGGELAKEHLEEDSHYYTKLYEMEKKMAFGGTLTEGLEGTLLNRNINKNKKVKIISISNKIVTYLDILNNKKVGLYKDNFIKNFQQDALKQQQDVITEKPIENIVETPQQIVQDFVVEQTVAQPAKEPELKQPKEKPKIVDKPIERLKEWSDFNMVSFVTLTEEELANKTLADFAISLSIPTNTVSRSNSKYIFDIINDK